MKIWPGLFFSFCLSSFAQAQAPFFQEGADDCCSCCEKFTFSADYLYWRLEDSPKLIPLVATAPVIHNKDPVLDEPGARVVLGGRHIHNDWRSGGKFGISYRIDNNICSYAEASYFFLSKDSQRHKVFSSGEPGSSYLAVPYFNTLTHLESSSPVAKPGSFRGLAKLHTSNWMQGAELNGWAHLYSSCSYSLNGMIGFRYWNFNDKVRFFVDSPEVNVPEDIYRISDKFEVQNNFYAGQVGFDFKGQFQCFSVDVIGKLALGAMRERSTIKGRFVTNSFDGFGAPETFLGGYFALPSNIGKHKRTQFAVMPEVNVNIGYQLTSCFSLNLGYTFLYVNRVLWAAKQMNRKINPTQSALYEFTPAPTPVGKASPKPSLRKDSLWVQGFNVGISYQF